MPPSLTRVERTEMRNQRIRDAFYQQYTSQPRPKKYTREYIVAQLAHEYCLSMATVERIILPKAA